MYPLCRLHEVQKFPKRQNKAKIGQKGQIFQNKPKKNQKSQNYPKFGFFVKFWLFCKILALFGKFKLLWNFLDFLGNFGFFGTRLLFVILEAT
jgi:hypothetical protein